MAGHAREHVYHPEGWTEAAGLPGAVEGGWVLPGVANLHSHAFQRAMAGLAERQGHPEDSFWTWRELMYRFAGRVTPESQHAIARQLYAEMLEAGYSSVCEFHYLHHQPDGRPYADPAAMSQSLVEAAREAGIRLTLLPVLYMSGGFDGRPLGERQRRFGHGLEAYLSLFETLRGWRGPGLEVGVALHSLRAVPEAAMKAVLEVVGGQALPIHVHVAEQLGEVQDCLSLRGARPVQWLLDHAPVDARWTLVHATHLEEAEVRGIARSGATVALCPSTEANLGDGLFPLPAFQAAGGHWGVGTDSHVSVSLAGELRLLEYGQRLQRHRRNLAAVAARPATGEALFAAALAGGRRAAFQPAPAPGEAAADWFRLEASAPSLAGARRADLLDRFVFADQRPLVRDAVVAGRTVVSGGRHVRAEEFADGYRRALEGLLAD